MSYVRLPKVNFFFQIIPFRQSREFCSAREKLSFHVISNCLSHVSICLKFKAITSAKKNIRGKQNWILKTECTKCYLSEQIHKIFTGNLTQWDIILFRFLGGDFFGSNNSICQSDS